MPLDDFGKKIINYRKKRDITQTQLAIEMGVSQGTVANWEFGKFKPKGEAYEKLKFLLDSNVQDIDTSDISLFKKICQYFTDEEIPILGKVVDRFRMKK
ncbi:Cro/C1-type helix-turn-helix domain [Spirosomataceae bacterium]